MSKTNPSTTIWHPPSLAEMNAITDVEMAFGSTQWLPPWEAIPKEFKDGFPNADSPYVKLVDAMLFERPLPEMGMTPNPGWEGDGEAFQTGLRRLMSSHLTSFEPKHEHKVAGVAYLFSRIFTLSPLEDALEEESLDD